MSMVCKYTQLYNNRSDVIPFCLCVNFTTVSGTAIDSFDKNRNMMNRASKFNTQACGIGSLLDNLFIVIESFVFTFFRIMRMLPGSFKSDFFYFFSPNWYVMWTEFRKSLFFLCPKSSDSWVTFFIYFDRWPLRRLCERLAPKKA